MTVTKQLRHCSAHVNINNRGFAKSYELMSYRTPVALYGMVDGEIVDVNGKVHHREGMTLLIPPAYDCSNTTMMHMRKFCEDYVGLRVTIADIRDALAGGNILARVYGGDIAVYMVENWG